MTNSSLLLDLIDIFYASNPVSLNSYLSKDVYPFLLAQLPKLVLHSFNDDKYVAISPQT